MIDDVSEDVERQGEKRGVLIWDVYASHLDEEVKKYAHTKDIKLLFVPAGMTWKRQPLDTHIFGPLKKRYQAHYFQHVYIQEEELKKRDCIIAFHQLLESVSAELVQRAFVDAIITSAKKQAEDEKLRSDETDPCPDPEKGGKKKGGAKEERENEEEEDDEQAEPQFEPEEEEEEEGEDSESDGEMIPIEREYRHPRSSHVITNDRKLAHNLEKQYHA
jgi:hypothetical protein